MAASEKYLVSLMRLSMNPDFKTVVEQMQSDLIEADKANRRKTGEVLYRSQGKALYIEEFLERLASARASIDKLRAK